MPGAAGAVAGLVPPGLPVVAALGVRLRGSRRSMTVAGVHPARFADWSARPAGSVAPLMSKRTKKATHRARKKKANHGRKPNRGRNS